MKKLYYFLLCFMLGLSSCLYDNEEELEASASPCDTSGISYSGYVRQFVADNCVSCHNRVTLSGGYDFEKFSVLQSVALSRMAGAISHSPGYVPMPDGKPKLDPCDIKKMKAWIAAGAPEN